MTSWLHNIKLKTLAVIMAIVLSLGLLPALTYADTASDIQGGVNAAAGCDSTTTTCKTSNAGTNISSTLATVINLLSLIVGIIAVIVIIVAGLSYVTSGGDDGKVSNAKKMIINAAIGLVIVAFAQIIVRFVIHASDSSSTTPIIAPAPAKTTSGGGTSGSGSCVPRAGGAAC